MRGFDKYLEWQLHYSGNFISLLFEAIGQADEGNLDRLAKGFPEEVEAYKVWTRQGRDAFLAGCSPDHPLVKAVKAGEKTL